MASRQWLRRRERFVPPVGRLNKFPPLSHSIASEVRSESVNELDPDWSLIEAEPVTRTIVRVRGPSYSRY